MPGFHVRVKTPIDPHGFPAVRHVAMRGRDFGVRLQVQQAPAPECG